MPKRLNPHENGLHRSSRLRASLGKEKLQKRKSHAIYVTASATKVVFGVISFFDLSSRVTIPKHWTNTNGTFTEQVMNQFHEVNELYDGTLKNKSSFILLNLHNYKWNPYILWNHETRGDTLIHGHNGKGNPWPWWRRSLYCCLS